MDQHFVITSVKSSGPGPYLQSPVTITWQTDLPATETISLCFGNNEAIRWIPIAKGIPNSGSYVWSFGPSDYVAVWAVFSGRGSVNLLPDNPLYASNWTNSWDCGFWLYLPPPPPPAPQNGPQMHLASVTPNVGNWGTTVNIAGSGFNALSDPSSYGGDQYGDGVWIQFEGKAVNACGQPVSGVFSAPLNPGGVTDTLLSGITIPSMLGPGDHASVFSYYQAIIVPPGVYSIVAKASQGQNVSNVIPFYLGVPPPGD